ncbi:MAG: metallophosphoesterase [Alphaproteobacteria bacterium]|nr:metallophosphoesterase [Alphaproteobacteria bacterium]
MTDKLRIAHCSDIHLDGDGYHKSADADCHYQSAFAHALSEMRAHKPDMMLLAGDLFDSNTATSETITWAMNILEEQPFPIIMIPGNHDCMTENAIYHRYDFNKISNVVNLTAEAGEVTYIEALNTAVWGKGMIDHSPDYNPLEGCPERPQDCQWYFGMGHGIHVPHGGDTSRSSPIHMSQLEESPCDYLALGHHHAALELINEKATAAYSGSPTDDVGLGATYIVIDLAKNTPTKVTVNAVAPLR